MRWIGGVLVVLTIVAGGLALHRTKGADAPVDVPQEAQVSVALKQSTSPIPPLTAGLATMLPASLSRVAPPASLSTNHAAVLAEQLALRQLPHAEDLPLTDDQWAAFAAVAAQYQAVRQAYEASIATVLPAGRGYRVAVPAYAEAGDALRDHFYGELHAQLGSAPAADIETRLGRELEAHFAGFGVSVQTLDVPDRTQLGTADLLVTRTATYWSSVDGEDRLTTRRQLHFPTLEDPTGYQWAPFLALLQAQRSSS